MTGFTLHRAARIEALAESLATRIRMELPTDPFSPVMIAVGSRGMERWLRNRLAVELGISANLAFPFPQQALSAVYGDPSGRRDPWEPDSLAWRVATALPGLLEDPTFAPLRTWLTRPGARTSGPSPVSVSRDLWTLAREVADVLDRAAWFRPEWTRAWEAGTTVTDAPAWQGALWRVLARDIEAPHPTRTLEGDPRPGDALHVFAVSSMPPTWLSALARAGTLRSVHVYLLTPSMEYWGDLRTPRELARLRPDAARDALDAQNPLLTAYGALARDAA